MADKEKRDWRMYYNKDSHNKAQAKYNKENTLLVPIRFNRKTDADIIEVLERQQNKAGYIKKLIRDDIARREKEFNELLYGTPEPPVQKVPTTPAQDEGLLYSNTPDDDT